MPGPWEPHSASPSLGNVGLCPLCEVFPGVLSSQPPLPHGGPWHPPSPTALCPSLCDCSPNLDESLVGARAQISALSSNHTSLPAHTLSRSRHLETTGSHGALPSLARPPESAVLHPTPMSPVSRHHSLPSAQQLGALGKQWAQALAHREASWAVRALDLRRGPGECGRDGLPVPPGHTLRPRWARLLVCLHSVGFLTKCFTLNNGLNSSPRVRRSTAASRLLEPAMALIWTALCNFPRGVPSRAGLLTGAACPQPRQAASPPLNSRCPRRRGLNYSVSSVSVSLRLGRVAPPAGTGAAPIPLELDVQEASPRGAGPRCSPVGLRPVRLSQPARARREHIPRTCLHSSPPELTVCGAPGAGPRGHPSRRLPWLCPHPHI